jgi:hypothetical protein
MRFIERGDEQQQTDSPRGSSILMAATPPWLVSG